MPLDVSETKILKYFNHLSGGRGKAWSSWSPQGMGGGWSEVVRETHWSEMISGLGWGSGFLSFYLWFSHIATETASASDSLSINHLIFFFLFFFFFGVQVIVSLCSEGSAVA